MVPQNEGYDFTEQIPVRQIPTNTYKLRVAEEEIRGNIDGLEAMKQAIYKILATQRYEYSIYDWNYGIELKDLIGKPKSYVIPEVKKRICEALLEDDRVQEVTDFDFTSEGNCLTVFFVVKTIFGEILAEKGVEF
ncbi:MAG: DUF2634 domain-containing protein [Epulopiscium sp.]|jgi:phage baseplate assembly protein W|nr:DUF2634 domain-containing protein [Candidatus Epulonipiscium sp.]